MYQSKQTKKKLHHATKKIYLISFVNLACPPRALILNSVLNLLITDALIVLIEEASRKSYPLSFLLYYKTNPQKLCPQPQHGWGGGGLTINVPVVDMVWDVLILVWATSITRAHPFQWPE